MHPTKQISIAVVEHAGCFLIGRERPPGDSAHQPDCGSFPGAKWSRTETAKEAAVRECREETGLAVEAEGTWLVQEEEYPHGRVRLHFTLADWLQDETGHSYGSLSAVCRGTSWPPSEFPSGNREVLKLLLEIPHRLD